MQSLCPSLKSFLRHNQRFFLFWAVISLCFRLIFLLKFPLLTNDSFVYGDLAKNWLQYGVYGQTSATGPEPTYIRLPGYPVILAVTWLVAGVEHYTAILIVQVVIDVMTCFVIADLARRIASERAAKVAFVITALCPFFANYAAVALTETWAIFFAALALDSSVAAFDRPSRRINWIVCGLSLSAGILFRPDGGMLLGIIGAYGLFLLLRLRSKQVFAGLALMSVVALAPLIPWTIRNWRTFHEFQPLTTVSATMPSEFVPHGFARWTRTWIADYSSMEDFGFKVDGEDVSIGDLPPRAWDNNDQKQQTKKVLKAYADNGDSISPQIDAQFADLARERIQAHPFRYYVGLPFLRAADLWFRPRTEVLPIDPHWWRLSEEDPPQFRWSILLASLNLLYIGAAVVAIIRGKIRYVGLFLAFALLRTAFLAWMPNPEPRYVLECFPALLAMAGAVFSSGHGKQVT